MKKSVISFSLFLMISALAIAKFNAVETAQPNPVTVIENCKGDFWNECVKYPYPVNYADIKDEDGVLWNIAFMDEYIGKDTNPEVIVLIHGKGVFGGYYSDLMTDLLNQDYRVIVPDLPHYGKSIPGNITIPVGRSLMDTRSVIHNLLTKKINIKKASFLGHSMGGQWVVGYAINYPDMVNKIILEAPGGIEEFNTEIYNVPFFSESLDNWDEWEKIWGNSLTQEQNKSAQEIYNFNYFLKEDKTTGEIVQSDVGYFLHKNEQSEYLTKVRQEMITASPQQFDIWTKTYIRDNYSMGREIRKEDARSLVKRIGEIKSPVFITFGGKEPFIPTTVFSDNEDLIQDLLKPAVKIMTENNNQPVVKIYPDAAHFIHIDIPEKFNNDVLRFLKNNNISDIKNLSTDNTKSIVDTD